MKHNNLAQNRDPDYTKGKDSGGDNQGGNLKSDRWDNRRTGKWTATLGEYDFTIKQEVMKQTKTFAHQMWKKCFGLSF